MTSLRFRTAGAALAIAMAAGLSACNDSAPSAVAPSNSTPTAGNDTSSTSSESSSTSESSDTSSSSTSSDTSSSTSSSTSTSASGSGGSGVCNDQYGFGGSKVGSDTIMKKFGESASVEDSFNLKYTVKVQPGTVQDPDPADYVADGMTLVTFKVHIDFDLNGQSTGMTGYQSYIDFTLTDPKGNMCASDSTTRLIPDNDPVTKGSTMTDRTKSIDGTIAYEIPKGASLKDYVLTYVTSSLGDKTAAIAWKN